MKKIVFCLILGLLLILISGLSLKYPQQSNAMFAEGGGGGFGTRIYVYAYNSGTVWRTRLTYYQASTGDTFTTTVSSGSYWELGFTINANDDLKWLTACVDPESNITTGINVSCRSYDAASTSNCQSIMNAASSISCGIAYGACGGPNDYPSAGSSGSYSLYATNYGTVAYSLCPIPNDNPGRDSQSDENKFRCAWGGYVTGVSYVGCRNTCTYRYCGGTSTSNVYWIDSAYSTRCGGNAISGTTMSTCPYTYDYSTTCSPPAPTVTATAVCNGVNPNINVNYSSNAGTRGNGDYDLRWRVSGGSWNEVCTVPTAVSGTDYTITSTALNDNTTYEVQVREHTDSGYNGPTAFGSDTVTTPSCATKNLVVSAISVPNGVVGASGNASVTIQNNGTQPAGASFSVGFLRDGSSASCATTYSAEVTTADLAAGASRVVSVPFTYPNVTGSHTAVAMVDSNCGITEDNEADNTRTDTYSVSGYNISGRMFIDTNQNDIWDTGSEFGYTTTAQAISVVGTTRTANTSTADGTYSISGNPNGTYNVNAAIPSGYAATSANPRSATINNANSTGNNFGIIQTCSISGNVYIDANNNGVKDTGEANYNGATLTLSGAGTGTATTNTSGNYSFTNRLPGAYTVTLTAPSGYTAPTPSQNATICPNATRNFRLVPTSTLTIHVYNDFNGNGVEDGVDTDSVGRTVTITGQGAGTFTTGATGNVVRSGLTAGNSTMTVTIPSGWTSTTTNPRTVSLPPTQTVNFGIRPPAPTCSGGLTANPTSVLPGGQSTLTAVGCSSPTGDPLTYNWYQDTNIAGDSVNPTTGAGNTTIWTAPNPWWTQVDAHPSVGVCNPGAVCTNYSTTVTITPRFTISGNVFTDNDKDTLQGVGEGNYTGGITITSSGGSVSYPAPSGNYLVSNLPGGNYTISYTSLPAGYQITYPVNGPPPSFSVRVGNASTGGACSEGSNSAACDANGNITNLKFGISNSIPWIQSIGGDITGVGVTNTSGGGFTDPIPPGATCGTYASLTGGGGSPGMIYAGAGSASFGSGQASQNPYNWVVGGLTYPEPINISRPLITSYSYVYSIAQQSGTINDISAYCGAGGINNCQLSGSIPNGFYISNGNLTLTGADYTFPGNTSNPRNFIILVNGDLNIQTEIHVPIGDTAFFTVSGNINVASNVGEAVSTSTAANVEGYYSTDRSFTVLGANTCPTPDRRLNVAGAIVVNASLTGGSFVNQRDLCAGNLQCPVFSIAERPDFVLYSPEYLRIRRVWREVAP